MPKIFNRKIFVKLLILIIVFTVGLSLGREYFTKNQENQKIEKNTPHAFVLEIYDKIKENYWNNISDAELLDLFKLSIAKNGGNINVPKFEDKNKLLSAISETTK